MVMLAIVPAPDSAPECSVDDGDAPGSPMRIPGGKPGTVAEPPVLAEFPLPDSVIAGRPEPTVLPPGEAENSPRRLPAGGCKGWSGAAGFTLRAIIRPDPFVPLEEMKGGGGTAPAERAWPACCPAI